MAKLDWGEDSDQDGVFDHPNLWGYYLDDPLRMDPYADLIQFYELETDTVWFRPIRPLREGTTYAVVLTNELRGAINQEPINSPFPFVHHLQQTEALRPIFEEDMLAKYGKSVDDVAYAWTFTTQNATEGLRRLREGIYGYGPFSHLEETYPAEVASFEPVAPGGGINTYKFAPETLRSLLEVLFQEFDVGSYSAERLDHLMDTYGAMDFLLTGDYIAPDFLDAGGGVFDIEHHSGKGSHQPSSLRFILTVPKKEFTTPGQPIPITFYAHGYGTFKIEALLVAGILAKFGIATFVIDSYAHGLPIGGDLTALVESLLSNAEDDPETLLTFYRALAKDRARDLNADGIADSGGDFWTNDIFHSRDMLRQTVLDLMQAIRVFRNFDGRQWNIDFNGDGILNDVAGDFDDDGIPDLGGPDANIYAMGTSNGGIMSSILAAIEPAVTAAAPISAGGSLLESGMRTDLTNIKSAVLLPILGPMVVNEPIGNPENCTTDTPCAMNLKWLVNDVFASVTVPFARVGERQLDGSVVEPMRPG